MPEHSISDSTYINWKAKYGGMTASEICMREPLVPSSEGSDRKKLVRRGGERHRRKGLAIEVGGASAKKSAD